MNTSIAIMQPYVFPYIGYFQLIDAVNTFVFYDDVHFIKKGWIHRNRVLMDGNDYFFTIPLQKASQNKRINEIKVLETEAWLENWYRTLYQCYAKAPNYITVMELIRHIMDGSYETISELAIKSVKNISSYIGLSTSFEVSSEGYPGTRGMEKADRLIAISKQSGKTIYINPMGGKELYEKSYFKEQGITLLFIENELVPYSQFKKGFVGGLSILDVLMFNSPKEITQLVQQYKLI